MSKTIDYPLRLHNAFVLCQDNLVEIVNDNYSVKGYKLELSLDQVRQLMNLLDVSTADPTRWLGSPQHHDSPNPILPAR